MNNWTTEKVYGDQDPLEIGCDSEKAELTKLFNNAVRLAKSDVEDQEALYQLGEGWVAEESVAIAIYCSIKYQDDFEEAIIAAANHDGDSDSTAAITGNIVGARIGYKNIPDYYKDNIELKDVILELADDMAKNMPLKKIDDRYLEPTDEWLNKYLYLEKKD